MGETVSEGDAIVAHSPAHMRPELAAELVQFLSAARGTTWSPAFHIAIKSANDLLELAMDSGDLGFIQKVMGSPLAGNVTHRRDDGERLMCCRSEDVLLGCLDLGLRFNAKYNSDLTSKVSGPHGLRRVLSHQLEEGLPLVALWKWLRGEFSASESPFISPSVANTFGTAKKVKGKWLDGEYSSSESPFIPSAVANTFWTVKKVKHLFSDAPEQVQPAPANDTKWLLGELLQLRDDLQIVSPKTLKGIKIADGFLRAGREHQQGSSWDVVVAATELLRAVNELAAEGRVSSEDRIGIVTNVTEYTTARLAGLSLRTDQRLVANEIASLKEVFNLSQTGLRAIHLESSTAPAAVVTATSRSRPRHKGL